MVQFRLKRFTTKCMWWFQLIILPSNASHCIFWTSSLLNFSTPKFWRLWSNIGARTSLTFIPKPCNEMLQKIHNHSFSCQHIMKFKIHIMGRLYIHNPKPTYKSWDTVLDGLQQPTTAPFRIIEGLHLAKLNLEELGDHLYCRCENYSWAMSHLQSYDGFGGFPLVGSHSIKSL